MDRGYIDYHLFERWSQEGAGFVARLKNNANCYAVENHDVPAQGPIRKDQTVVFNPFHAGRKILGRYRRVEVWVEEKKETLVLLTNRHDLAATTSNVKTNHEK